MINIVILMDCHGVEIKKYLKLRLCDFVVNHISLVHYVNRKTGIYSKRKSLLTEHINLLKNADILILQVIEKDRGFLNNCEVTKYSKPDCKIIKIPHYRNSIYLYKCLENRKDKQDLIKNWQLPNKIKDINNINLTKQIISNEIDKMNNYRYDKNDMLTSMNFKINEFKKIDNQSDIKMFDYFINNYKKYRLFQGRGYPSSRFFFELVNKILIRLNYNPNTEFIDHYYAQNTGEPIPYYWYKFCNFSFDNIYFTKGNIQITECEWYYILLLSKNINITSIEENLKYLSMIRN
jgi:hypothetical protein